MGDGKVGSKTAGKSKSLKVFHYRRDTWLPCNPVTLLIASWLLASDFIHSFPRNVFTTSRIAFSFRRYQRHCPCFVTSTNPALDRMFI